VKILVDLKNLGDAESGLVGEKLRSVDDNLRVAENTAVDESI
jgi:hypothetical protein